MLILFIEVLFSYWWGAAIYLTRGANRKPNILKITREIKMIHVILKIFFGLSFI